MRRWGKFWANYFFFCRFSIIFLPFMCRLSPLRVPVRCNSSMVPIFPLSFAKEPQIISLSLSFLTGWMRPAHLFPRLPHGCHRAWRRLSPARGFQRVGGEQQHYCSLPHGGALGHDAIQPQRVSFLLYLMLFLLVVLCSPSVQGAVIFECFCFC